MLSNSRVKKTQEFQGISISAGKILASACLYSGERHKSFPTYELKNSEQITKEIVRFDESLSTCTLELDTIISKVRKNVGRLEAEIFMAQKHIMNDPEIIEKIREKIEEDKKNAEYVISEVFNSYEERFATFDNEYLRERASDIGEIRRRLLDYLRNKKRGFICDGQKHCNRGKNKIIVAEELTIEMMEYLNCENIMGFVTKFGGITSHAAIVARSLGVPAVSGINGLIENVECGESILLDGENGKVYLRPSKNLISSIISLEQIETDKQKVCDTPAGMEVLANACMVEDVKLSMSQKADGIGLFRTEIQFMISGRLLSEKEQFDFYRKIVSSLDGKTITFRLLDVGGDKTLPFLKIEKESNPCLGWRGARFLLGNPHILGQQVIALGKLSKMTKIKILFPMIIDTVQLKKLCIKVREILNSEPETNFNNIELGAMFEVPSACLQAKGIFEMVDFASIGSNDLIQYLFAVDRTNERVSQDFNPEHPVFWEILENISAEAKKAGKPLSICGEIAGREGMVKRLIEIGITSLSVNPRNIQRVRNEMIQAN